VQIVLVRANLSGPGRVFPLRDRRKRLRLPENPPSPHDEKHRRFTVTAQLFAQPHEIGRPCARLENIVQTVCFYFSELHSFGHDPPHKICFLNFRSKARHTGQFFAPIHHRQRAGRGNGAYRAEQ
jgi:hypothetical protein